MLNDYLFVACDAIGPRTSRGHVCRAWARDRDRTPRLPSPRRVLQAALVQLEMRRRIVQGLREAGPQTMAK